MLWLRVTKLKHVTDAKRKRTQRSQKAIPAGGAPQGLGRGPLDEVEDAVDGEEEAEAAAAASRSGAAKASCMGASMFS